MRYFIFIFIIAIFIGCSGSDDPSSKIDSKNEAPSTPVLINPVDGLLCTTSTLDLDWSNSIDPEGDNITYLIEVSTDNGFIGNKVFKSTSALSTSFVLQKGVAYYWRVKARDSKSNESDYSKVQKFYTEGDGVSNYLPYAPAAINPINNASISTSSIDLNWEASDVDGDPLIYDVYFGDVIPPVLVAQNISDTTYNVDLEANITYYWKIVVKDDKGGQSIGQMWSFRTQ